MRILMAADVWPDPNAGAAGTEMNTAAALREAGHTVDEIWAPDLGRRISHGNLHYVLELPGNYLRLIQNRSRASRYDVFHFNQPHCYRAAKWHGREQRQSVFVCRSHGLDDHMERVLRPWRRELGIRGRSRLKSIPGHIIDHLLDRHMRLAVRFSDGFIVSSSLDRDYLKNFHGMPVERCACIHQAPAECFLSSSATPLTASRLERCLYIANYGYFKGPHAVAQAANLLVRKSRSWRLTWICAARDHDAVRALLSRDALAKVDLLEPVPQSRLRQLYDEHGIFIYPPLFDGFGKVFLEAMARGLCVVATPAGGMKDIIAAGRNGVLVDFHSPEQIAGAVIELGSNPARAIQMGGQARATAEEHTWARVARETSAFYRHLLDARQRQHAL